ncbi:peptide-methionine (R)-S-oxide reductase MsrB [Altererythrobacter indicus]|uniref:peptide-methionine (R)-S-oxide reductase n=1 Tax=Altericroceibacterium indicum TaxID=374177 RepID=A0A845AA41_9SPHN|nr:peptide-methionine (R)-S-oxide reductase MsrB [Altericroceibacterium indicum]MXP26377.1 peptide-methionine (R)-S-oxide reductase MsrB [Altericroceibacterium indicum]
MQSSSLHRRSLLAWLGSAGCYAALTACGSKAEAKTYPFSLSDAQWKARLTPAQYRILRRQGTERPYSSPLNDEKRKGIFRCAGCKNHLFSSRTKFDSGTGWPSFWEPLPGKVEISRDFALGYPRNEVHCANCGGHLGHVFNDGPKPTGKRYCMNGAAMTFLPA